MSGANPALWLRAMDEFDRLVDLDPGERQTELAALVQESQALADQVQGLLDADSRAADAAENHPTQTEARPRSVEWPRVAGFRVLGVLGQGGMGEVFLAERATEDFVQRVALKRMSVLKADAGLHERFLRERRILAQLNHRHIARLLDGGLDEDGNPYFAMELVEGVSLTRYASNHALDLNARLRLFVVVCEAVAYAHRNLIVHRDIKPSNVLVDAQGQVKLLDFGIAKLIAPGDSEATATLSMTPAYAAPEQLLGEAISTATDVYALGLLLFELLVGNLPERTWRERMRDAVSEQNSVERPSASVLQQAVDGIATQHAEQRQRRRLAQQLRGDLDQIVLLALRRDPTRRYASAQALAEDVTRYLQGHPVQARADHWRYRLSKFVTRHAWSVAAGSIAVLGLIAASVVSLTFAERERSARALADAERRTAVAQAERAERTKQFVVSLFRDIDPLNAARGKGTDYTAAELLDEAARRVAKDLSDVPASQAELRIALAQSLKSLGRSKSALPLLDAGIDQLRTLYGDAHPNLSSALLARAQARVELADLDGAERDAREALTIALSLPGSQEIWIARIQIRTTLAKLLYLRSNYAESIAQYHAILTDRIAVLGSESDAGLAVDWNNLASAYLQVERYADAETSMRRAMQLFAAASGAEHPRMVWLHNGLGFALLGQQRYAEAQVAMETAKALALAKLDARHPILVSVEVGLGRVARERGDYVAADRAFAEAIAIATEHNHPSLGAAEIHLGLSLLAQQRFTEAELQLQRGIQRSSELGAERPDPLVLHGTIARGLALVRLDRATEGEALARTALASLATVVDSTGRRYAEGAKLYAKLR